MAYYVDVFAPDTYEAFSRSDRTVSGFGEGHQRVAARIQPGDKLICYMTKLSRWIGLLEVVEGPFRDESPLFYPQDDPYIIRFKVEPSVWLPVEKAVPIHADRVWNQLSFTRDQVKGSPTWTGKLRSSLVRLDEEDGEFLEGLLREQANAGEIFPVDEGDYRKLIAHRIRRSDRDVTVTVPEESEPGQDELSHSETRESILIQALLAQIGAKMGMSIWLPRGDRARVLEHWQGSHEALLERLPLNYDETTLRTVEQIDVLWLRGRAIKRAFEVEHTTSVYSGLLRMADLLALQPNMDIRLHIVAPTSRREKVFQELLRPVFSLLERGPLAELCTYLSYENTRQLADQPHLPYLPDSVIMEYEERAEG